ncbi:ferritin-like domain-containing protein [Paraphoma chrysanthemicola]|uniref:Ferritin-like domain-containing protein n=1 Tax=Paraphoma chrysanthemicola TaxID=798071 RepID=A0A8K0RKU5_9PLEO|nr:ferritin-like domain-containing protein [Paraphoma chrysanthemicola]
MPSVSTILKGLMALAPLAAAAPAHIVARSSAAASATEAAKAAATPAAAPAGGLSDVDILNFALTAEHLESAFYQQGFAKFPMADFMALGLSETQVKSLMNVGQTEATHVTTLQSAIAGAGAKPVEACQYNFDAALTSADSMVKTARVLEAIGVSAYLGAAPLINSSDILAAAGSIVTVEARHQAFIRVASGAEPVPAAFDTALQPRAVFTLAAQFIQSCPEGSNLNIQAFPAIALQNPEQATVGQNLKLADPAQPSGASFCAFVAPGGNQFTPITDGNCMVPQNLQGEVYMMITKSQAVTDSEVLAGPSVIQPS